MITKSFETKFAPVGKNRQVSNDKSLVKFSASGGWRWCFLTPRFRSQPSSLCAVNYLHLLPWQHFMYPFALTSCLTRVKTILMLPGNIRTCPCRLAWLRERLGRGRRGRQEKEGGLQAVTPTWLSLDTFCMSTSLMTRVFVFKKHTEHLLWANHGGQRKINKAVTTLPFFYLDMLGRYTWLNKGLFGIYYMLVAPTHSLGIQKWIKGGFSPLVHSLVKEVTNLNDKRTGQGCIRVLQKSTREHRGWGARVGETSAPAKSSATLVGPAAASGLACYAMSQKTHLHQAVLRNRSDGFKACSQLLQARGHIFLKQNR